MMDMMRACWQWMMSLDAVGMLLGFALLGALVAAVVLLVVRFMGRSGRPLER